MITHSLSHARVLDLVNEVRAKVQTHLGHGALKCYPIPRGGVPAAYMLMAATEGQVAVTSNPEEADFFLDDIIDSGATMERICDEFPGKPFFALIDKMEGDPRFPGWVVFPWEGNEQSSIEDNIRRIIQYIGDDPTREGLLETPARVAKAYREWFQGYRVDIPSLFKCFEDGAQDVNEMVIVRSIPVESFCEHHMARFTGVAHVAYIPTGKIVGLSKIARLVDAFSRRMQVQERLTNQIANAMVEHLSPAGVGVVVIANHTCMSTRGARVHGTDTVTSAMRGVLMDKPESRAEFMSLLSIK